jgi:hypothetical protein
MKKEDVARLFATATASPLPALAANIPTEDRSSPNYMLDVFLTPVNRKTPLGQRRERSNFVKMRNAMIKQHLKKNMIMARQTPAKKERFYLAICGLMEWEPTAALKDRILEDAAPSLYRRHQYKKHPNWWAKKVDVDLTKAGDSAPVAEGVQEGKARERYTSFFP